MTLSVRFLPAWLALAILLPSCSTPSEAPDALPADAADMRPDGTLFNDVVFNQDFFTPDQFTTKDQWIWDTHTDVSADSDADTFVYTCGGKACAGDPCLENDDCESTLCVYHMGDRICSNACIEECPDGFQCLKLQTGPDQAFACLSKHSHLCLPCVTDSDCSSEGVKIRCLDYGEAGRFCGSSCSESGDCPAGYDCLPAAGVDGVSSMQCVNKSGECPCSKTAVALALSTYCQRSNPIGLCEGIRACGPEGLGDCTALQPSGESCDGIDNDCDGETDNGACDDDNVCTQDHCDAQAGCSYSNLDNNACDDGDACTFDDKCLGGLCTAQPLVCNDGNPCTTDLCDQQTGCVYSYNEENCTDSDPCTYGDRCYMGECHPGPQSDCDDDNVCTDDYCDEQTVCRHVPNAAECTDYNECTLGDHCDGGYCVPMGSIDCDDNNPCTTDACDSAGGCIHSNNTESCTDGSLCTENDYCLGGQCHAGTPKDCNDNNVCTDDYCDPNVGCLHVNNTASCNDGDPCTVTDKCNLGQCVGTGALNCDDGKVCTTDTCVPKSGCLWTNNANPCSDGSECTLGDTCGGGVCIPGTALNCDDGNVCTADSCVPATGCLHDSLSGSSCSDNNLCTKSDKCQAGICVPGTLDTCDDGKQCTADSCSSTLGCIHENIVGSCNDGNACTVGDSCVADTCVAGSQQLACDDGDPCTGDSCNASTGCKHANLTGNSCDDLNACTDDDVCQAGVCVAGFVKDCSDGNVCTDDKCDVVSGCYYTANTASCEDGSKCTEGDKCSAKTCKAGSVVVCNDNNVCTSDACVPETGCVFTKLTGTSCTDNSECTVGDKCSNGTCAPGTTLDCNDNNVCTQDSCIAATGCAHDPVTGVCTDNNACTENDYCSAGSCKSGTALVCNDNKQCTDDTCNTSTGCVYTNDNTNSCTDSNACTINDHCSAGVCVNDGAPNCSDGNQCTTDLCIPASGCSNPLAANGTSCTDSNMCTTVDTCQNGVCVGSTPLTCTDGKPCTYDNCDPVAGCVFPNVPDNTSCNDGNYCTSGDHCSSGLCVKTSDTVCAAQICKNSVCNSSLGACVYTAVTPCCGNSIKETTGTAHEECDDGCTAGDPATCDTADNGDGCEQDCTLTCFFKDIRYMYCNGSCSYAGDLGCDQNDANVFCKLKTCNPNATASYYEYTDMKGVTVDPQAPGITCPGTGTNKGPQTAYGVSTDVWYTATFRNSYGTGTFVIKNVTCNDP